MKTFLSIFKNVAGWLAKTGVPLAGAVTAIVAPQFSPLVNALQSLIVTAEANNPGDGQGKIKLDAVKLDFQASLALTQQALAAAGKKLTFDEAKLEAAVSAQVQAYNAIRDLHDSFKVENA